MNTTAIAILCTIGINLALGILVYLTNTRRTANQFFLALCVHISIWAVCVLKVVEAETAQQAEWWIRGAFAVTALFPASVAVLHLAIKYPAEAIAKIYRRSTLFWALNLAAAGLCLSRFFLAGVSMPATLDTVAVPEAIYGPGFTLFTIYFALTCLGASIRFFKDLSGATGMEKAEFQFVLTGFVSSVIIGGTTALIIPLFSDSTQTSQFGPLSTISLSLIIAYGIAKHRIMDVAQMLRKITAYALLTLSLAILYAFAWWLTTYLLGALHLPSHAIPNLVAALIVAFSMTPAYGYMQRFANQLFINTQDVDIAESMRQTSHILHTISTVPDLLQRFATMITQAVGTEYCALLLCDKGAYTQQYPDGPGKYPHLTLTADDPLIQRLQQVQEPVVVDTLLRRRPTRSRLSLAQKLMGLKTSIAIGIPARERLDGIMLLGPRLSGRIYGKIEQNALQLLCEQLAVALENARMYTDSENSKIYNEILLESMVNGVIAANADGHITVYNKEARRMVGMEPWRALQQPVDVLPTPLTTIFKQTLETGQETRDLELVIKREKEEYPVRVSSTIFRGHTGRVMGVLLVLSDQTQIRKLQMQVRHTDRLASVGTLSAGMAHEIKNPLVSLKTFSQLLPERYDDPDFRETFSSLLQSEVHRIDSIVNQLLHFARPAKPELQPTSLHTVLEGSLRLVEQQLQHQGIKLETRLQAQRDRIHGDPGLLDQAFLNFFLNAIEAIESKGHLRIATDVVHDPALRSSIWTEPETPDRIRVTIADSGNGIAAADLPSIFDPFFTTKSEGTGLGLSVTHGIIQDHGGTIEVDSEQEKGTSFHISFPLIKEEVSA